MPNKHHNRDYDIFDKALDNPEDLNEAEMLLKYKKDRYNHKRQPYPTREHDAVQRSPERKKQNSDFWEGAGTGGAAFLGQRALRRVVRGKPLNMNEVNWPVPMALPLVVSGAAAGGLNNILGRAKRTVEHDRKKKKAKAERWED